MKQQETKNGLYGSLCQGRSPFAVAELHGGGCYPGVRGRVDFYATPAGILVSAKVSGLPGRGGKNRKPTVYGFCLENQDEGCGGNNQRFDKKHNLGSFMPPLYEKDGTAWCSVITGKLMPADLAEKSISIRENLGDSPYILQAGREIATGRVVRPEC